MGSRRGETFLNLAGREKIQTPVPICAHPGRHFRQMQSFIMGPNLTIKSVATATILS